MSKAKSSPQPTGNRLYLGIDLGTSRSAVCGSNGQRSWVSSYVGWPKDFVARKALGAPVLFGEQATKSRLSLNLHRPLEHGVIKEGGKDEEAVGLLVEHLISLAQPGEGQQIYATVGVPAESFKTNRIAIKRCLKDKVLALMVVSEPFAVAYGKDLLDNALVIDIGAGTIDWCIMHGTVPGDDDQRTVTTAGDHLDSQLHKALTDKFPKVSLNVNMARQFKESFSFVGDPPEPVVVDMPVDGKATKHDITAEMRQVCESIMPAVIETTAELISRFDPEYQDAVRRNIILAGGGSQIRGLARYIEREIGHYGPCKVKTVDDPLYSGAHGCLVLAKEMPTEYWEDAQERDEAAA